MLKWTLGHKIPTPGPFGAAEGLNKGSNVEPKAESSLHFARRRKSCGAVRRASVKALKRQLEENKENQPVGPGNVAFRGNGIKTPLKDLSNSPSPYQPTPRRRIRRRQSCPLRLTEESVDKCENDSPLLLPTIRRDSNGIGEVVDTQMSTSTLKTSSTMQIEYSPGPLTATQSLMSLRRRLTHSIAAKVEDNPLLFARIPTGIDATLNNESSPSFDNLWEEKSILDQVSNRSDFVNTLRRQNTKVESCLVTSLSQRLEWLRLNSSLGRTSVLEFSGENDQGKNINKVENDKISIYKRLHDGDMEFEHKVKRLKDCDNLDDTDAVRRRCRKIHKKPQRTSYCDRLRAKTDSSTNLMGLTLPMGIPSPNASYDSGLCSIGLEGIHPLNISPIRGSLTEETVSALVSDPAESTTSSLLVNKFSPFSNASSVNFNKLSSSSLGSSLRKRLNDEELELNGSIEEMESVVKNSRLDNCNEDSPLALVEKRSRSRRCLRFVSPGGGTRRRSASFQNVSKLKDIKQSVGDLELRVYSRYNMLTIQVGKANELHRPGGRACNAYAKVALVPSSERTFYRTPVQRESSSPNFDEKFSFELQPEDLNKRILVSVWHRDRENRRSEFLGCVSLAVKNAIKKEISGCFRLAAQGGGGSKTASRGLTGAMARRSECSSVEETITVDSEEAQDDSSFLRHLELEAEEAETGRPGKTLFTTTKLLSKSSNAGFGLSIAWTQPPRIERIEPGQAAEKAGIWPGDYVIFVDKHNVVTKTEDQVLQLIRSCGNVLPLEIYRKSVTYGIPESANIPSSTTSSQPAPTSLRSAPQPFQSPRSGATTTASLDLNKRRLHLPHVAFSSESAPSNLDEPQKRAVYQLLSKEQSYAVNLQFGVNRFLLPLAERKDYLNASQHHTLFQNIEELLRISEDIIEQAVQEDMDFPASFLGRIYVKRISVLTTAYRRYCSGIKRADCLLVEKSKNSEFTRFCTEPPIPKRKPDLTTFLHKPLEHFRELLKLTTTVLNQSKSSEEDHYALSRVVLELDTSYREWTAGAGIMEPSEEGRPLLSVQDLESRLVFTRCKPFVLSAPGRQWIFGGDLSRVEGRSTRPFWTLLFTDIMVFSKVSRDRVLFITEEPLSLISISQAFFNVRKKANEFRLLINSSPTGTDSPANAMCGPDLVLSRTPKNNAKCRSIVLRAPNAELKAVWQNLIQRQIIHLNTTRGGTPASSPLESPDPPTTLSVATLDSLSLRRQILPDSKTCVSQRGYEPKQIEISKGSTKQLNELIDHKCRQLGKTKTSKGGAMHLAEWMKGQLGANCQSEQVEKNMPEPEPEIWSQEELKRRTTQLNVVGNRNESRCEDIDIASERSVSRNTEFSQQSFSTSESITTVKSNHGDRAVSVCKQCRATCLKADADDDDDFDDTWGSLMLCGMSSIRQDPFAPDSLPAISVLPPTPDKQSRCAAWEGPPRSPSVLGERCCSSAPCSPIPTITRPHCKISEIIEGDEDEDTPEGSLQSSELDQPYRTLSSSLRRFGTLASLEHVGSDDPLDDDDSDEEPDDDRGEFIQPSKRIEEHTSPILSRSSIKETKRPELTSPIRNGKTYPEVIEPVRSWVAPAEVAHPVRGWTARAGSFVAEKMALFERLSTGDSTTVRKTSFLERYLKPNGEGHLDSPPDQGTNTSSSGRGEDEGETSGATSGEEVWGTPTSGGEFEEELVAESSNLSLMDSPHGSLVGGDDDTEQLMEDLLISLPMLAARAPGVPPRRRLEPLPEEDDTESSSAPCSPKPLHEIASEQGRGSSVYQMQHHDNCPDFGKISSHRPIGNRRDAPARPRIGTIDRALGIQSDEEDEDEEKSTSSNSIFHRLGLRRNREDGRKSSRFGDIIQGQFQRISRPKNMNLPALSKQLDKLPSARNFLAALPTPSPSNTKQHIQRIVYHVTKRARTRREVVDLPHIEVVKWGNDRFGSDWSTKMKSAMKKIPKLPEAPIKPLRRTYAIRNRSSSPTYSYGELPNILIHRLGFLSGKKEGEGTNRNSAAYGGKPLFRYLFNRDTVDDIPTTLPRTYNTPRNDGKQLERRFWKQLRRRRSSTNLLPSTTQQVAT